MTPTGGYTCTTVNNTDRRLVHKPNGGQCDTPSLGRAEPDVLGRDHIGGSLEDQQCELLDGALTGQHLCNKTYADNQIATRQPNINSPIAVLPQYHRASSVNQTTGIAILQALTVPPPSNSLQ
jgi:hypothetical protein